MRPFLACVAMGLILATWTSVAWSADEAAPKDKVVAATAFRASALTGLEVRNKQGDKLGTVNDLVIDIRTGKIAYVAMSMGGILGVGDKLFAVPYGELTFDHGADDKFFVLNMTKEKLDAAPGFDQANWPNFADPRWSESIDKYYRESRTPETRTKSRDNGAVD